VAMLSGWVYLASVIDVFSRMTVGWRVSRSTRTDLPLDVLAMALASRYRQGSNTFSGLVNQSNAGSQGTGPRATRPTTPQPMKNSGIKSPCRLLRAF